MPEALDGLLETSACVIGWDETDFDKQASISSDGKYTIHGGVDISAIGGEDCSKLQQRLVLLAGPLDEVIEAGTDSSKLVPAIKEIEAEVPRLRSAVTRARCAYAKRVALYDKRNNPQPGGLRKARRAAKGQAKPKAKASGHQPPLVAELDAALEDKSLPSAEGLTRDSAALLTGRFVRRFCTPTADAGADDVEEDDVVIGAVNLMDEEEDREIWFECKYPEEALDQDDQVSAATEPQPTRKPCALNTCCMLHIAG